jgi:hypothetical protein
MSHGVCIAGYPWASRVTEKLHSLFREIVHNIPIDWLTEALREPANSGSGRFRQKTAGNYSGFQFLDDAQVMC